MKGIDVWSYSFEKDGITVVSGRRFRTLQMAKLYCRKDMQESKIRKSKIYHEDRFVAYLHNDGDGKLSIIPNL